MGTFARTENLRNVTRRLACHEHFRVGTEVFNFIFLGKIFFCLLEKSDEKTKRRFRGDSKCIQF